MRLLYFDYFRAIAIILVVAGHCYGTWAHDTILERAVVNIITGATAPFVFISGFFFHHVFYKKFDYKKFMLSKAKKVYVPFLILSVLFLCLKYLNNGYFPNKISPELNYHFNAVELFAYDLAVGAFPVAYWYIPFIMIIFLMSPIVIFYIKLPMTYVVPVLFILFCLSLYTHRPLDNLNVFHSVLYFLPFYLMGVTYSQNKETINEWLDRNLWMIFAAFTLVVLLMSALGQNGNMHKLHPFEWQGLDLMVIQKILLIFVLLGALKRIEGEPIRPLIYIANISFAIFFIHPWVLKIMRTSGVDPYFIGAPGFLARAFIALTVSIAVAELVKLAFKERSVYLVGY